MKLDSKSEPCGNEDCDKCDPRPRWKISQQRIQHLTRTREIKAASVEEALRLFETPTPWPSQYKDNYGEIVQLDAPVTETLPPDEYHLTECCFHDPPAESDAVPELVPDERSLILGSVTTSESRDLPKKPGG